MSGFEAGNYNMSWIQSRGLLNDDASSITLQSGYQVTVYQHDNFGGYSYTVTSNASCLTNYTNNRGDGSNWNDDITSIKVVNTSNPGVVQVYADENHLGQKYSLNEGSYTMEDLNNIGIGNDQTSSIEVSSGYKVTVYQHNNYAGYSWECTSSVTSLNNTDGRGDGTTWNNDISSLVVATTGSSNPPVADFSTSTTSVTEGSSVDFTDNSSNNPISWSWSFEGGSPSGSSSQNPSVTYNTAGTYDVTLTATNSQGSDTETKTNYITVTAAGGDCISSFPYSKSFETGFGGFTQNTDDDFDWTRNSGGTPSNNTGPSGAADGSYYLYTEASNPNNPNKRAILTSSCFDLTGISNPAFEFQYHMYGSDLGTMDVQVSTNGGSSWTTEWSRTGNQGNSWHAASVDLNSYTNSSDVLIRFNTINSGWSSDFSIDHVVITASSAADIDHTDPPGTGTITARAEVHSGEGKEKAFDNLFASGNFTKWLDNDGVPSTSNPSWIQIQLPAAVVVNKLAIVSANDDFGRDPEDFNLRGSNNGSSWTTLNSWSGQNWANRYERKDFSFSNSTAYSYYRLNITKNDNNVSMTQLCEIMLIGPDNKSAVAADHLSEQNNNSRFRVYPNPVYDVFTIESPGNLITTINIVDIQGRLVYKNTFTDKLNINTSDISGSGILFIKLTNENDSYIEKLIIK